MFCERLQFIDLVGRGTPPQCCLQQPLRNQIGVPAVWGGGVSIILDRKTEVAGGTASTTRQCSLFVSLGGYLQHHQPCQLSRGQHRYDLIPEAPPGQEQQSPPGARLGMGKQHRIIPAGSKPKGSAFSISMSRPLCIIHSQFNLRRPLHWTKWQEPVTPRSAA